MNGRKWHPKTYKTTSIKMERSITGASSTKCGHCTSQRNVMEENEVEKQEEKDNSLRLMTNLAAIDDDEESVK